MAIADVYDALISKRQYKDPMPHESACIIIESGSGTQFDPLLVDVFRNIKDQFEQIWQDFSIFAARISVRIHLPNSTWHMIIPFSCESR